MLGKQGKFDEKGPGAVRLEHGASLDVGLAISEDVRVHLIDFRFHNIHSDHAGPDTGVIEAFMEGRRIVPTTAVWGRPGAPGFHVILPMTKWGTHAVLVHDNPKLCRRLSGRRILFSFRWLDDHKMHALRAKSFEYFLVTE
jgi:hypothetical protein